MTQFYNDEKFVNLALNLASKHIGSTSNNPIVACVIVKNNNIISTGITSQNGRPHAEINALNKITDKSILDGASLYVTLEPCCHFGKTPPCTDEIIKHKFSRIIICSIDPDHRVNGEGVNLLRKSGIEVIVGFREKDAQLINRAFFKAKNTHKPFVSIKVATSLDGKIATQNYQSQWISNEESRKFSHYLRSQHQAIMVGANTIIKDNPELNCRINGLENFSPTKIIVSNDLNFTFNEKIFVKNLQFPTIILCSIKNKNNQKINTWLSSNKNNKVIFCETVNNKIDLNNALTKLYENNINSILIEGGKSLITQFIQQDLIDELIWIRSNKIIGNDGLPAFGNLDLKSLNDSLNKLKLSKLSNLDNDILEIYRRA